MIFLSQKRLCVINSGYSGYVVGIEKGVGKGKPEDQIYFWNVDISIREAQLSLREITLPSRIPSNKLLVYFHVIPDGIAAMT
jgi:hypothetical protein